MKTQRHAAILKVVRRDLVGSQEQLRELLRGEGFDVTQATLSRDIRELGLAKVSAPDGASHYAPPTEIGGDPARTWSRSCRPCWSRSTVWGRSWS